MTVKERTGVLCQFSDGAQVEVDDTKNGTKIRVIEGSGSHRSALLSVAETRHLARLLGASAKRAATTKE